MRNGWHPISMARPMYIASYLDDNNPETVLLWVRGYGVATGYIYDTPAGLIAKAHGYSNVKIDGFQLCPRGPRWRPRRAKKKD